MTQGPSGAGPQYGAGGQSYPPAQPPGGHGLALAVDPHTYGASFATGQPYNTAPHPRPATKAGRTLGLVATVVAVPLGPLGAVLGFISFQRARRGRGTEAIGIAAMIVGALSTSLVVLLVLARLAVAVTAYSPPEPGPASGPPQPGQEIGIGQMSAGDCAHEAAPTVTLVDCERWHQVEAFTEVPLGAGEYPGEGVLEDDGAAACLAVVNEYALPRGAPDVVEVAVLIPDRTAWGRGVTSGLCLLVHTHGPDISGSISDGNLTLR